MRLVSAAAAALATAAYAVAVADAAEASSGSARIYLYPAREQSKAASVSPVQLNKVLAHHFGLPDEELGVAAADKGAWAWLPQAAHSGKDAIESLFGTVKQRTAVLVSGLSDIDIDDVMAAPLRNTHIIAEAPHISSFEALLQSYGERLFAATSGISHAFRGLSKGVSVESENALESASEVLSAAKNEIRDKIAALEAGAHEEGKAVLLNFYESLATLTDHFGQSQPSSELPREPYRALRLDGLADVKAAYGEDSSAYGDAKSALRNTMSAVADTLQDLATSRQPSSGNVAFVVMPENGVFAPLEKREDPLSPFRASIATTPFLKSRDENDSSELRARQADMTELFDPTLTGGPDATVLKKPDSSDKPKQPKEKDYIGKCFTSEDDLNKATGNCYGHGDPKQTQKGGRKCYRCQCKVIKGKNGKLTQWAGDACQKQDISKEFVLLGTTAIALIVTAIGSVLYLYSEGAQELPSVLAGVSIPNK